MSRRRLDADDFDPDEVDEDGLPLVGCPGRAAAGVRLGDRLVLLVGRVRDRPGWMPWLPAGAAAQNWGASSPCCTCTASVSSPVSPPVPQVYNEESIAAYWSNRPGELTSRWTKFAGISGGLLACQRRVPPLHRRRRLQLAGDGRGPGLCRSPAAGLASEACHARPAWCQDMRSILISGAFSLTPLWHAYHVTPVSDLPAVPWLTKLANGFIQGRLQDSTTQVGRRRRRRLPREPASPGL